MNFEEKEKTLSTGICRFVKKITKLKNQELPQHQLVFLDLHDLYG